MFIKIPICVKCSVQMDLRKTSMPILFSSSSSPIGVSYADYYHCAKCGSSIVTGFGDLSRDEEQILNCLKNSETIYIEIG